MAGSVAAWAPAAAWAGVIFVLSAQPGLRVAQDPDLDQVLRELAHVAVFGILAMLVLRAMRRTTRLARPSLVAAIATFAYAVTDELHQATVPSRTADWFDLLMDGIGIVLALGAIAGFGWLDRRRRRHAAGGASAPLG